MTPFPGLGRICQQALVGVAERQRHGAGVGPASHLVPEVHEGAGVGIGGVGIGGVVLDHLVAAAVCGAHDDVAVGGVAGGLGVGVGRLGGAGLGNDSLFGFRTSCRRGSGR